MTLKYLGKITMPAGPQGPIGLPGVNGVANDTATGSYIAEPTSATYAALDSYATKTLVRSDRTVRVAIGGESHAAGGSTNSPLGRSSREPLAWAQFLAGGRFNYVWNFGLGSSSIASAMVRLQGALDQNPDAVVLLSGTYDMNPSPGVPFSSYQASIQEFVTRVRAIGAIPIIGTVYPTITAGAFRSNVEKANIWLRQWCALNGVPLLETYNRLIDPATGAIKTSLSDSTGVHAGPAGNKLIAADLIELLNAHLPLWAPPLAGHQTSDSLNMVPNGLFLTDSNADGTPDGWSKGAGATALTASLVAGGTDNPGNWLNMTSTDGTAAVLRLDAANLPMSKWAVGDRIAICGRFQHNPGTSTKSLGIQITFAGGTPNSIRPVSAWEGQIDNGIFYAEDVIPSGTVQLTIEMIHNAGTLGTGLSSRLGQLTVLNLTKLGLA